MEKMRVAEEHRTFGQRDPRDDGQLDELARLTYGHQWNDLSPTERQELELCACAHLSIGQGRRLCPIRGKLNPKCSPGCPEHLPVEAKGE